MLKNGFKVTAVDNSQEGIKKIEETVQTNNLAISNINLLCEDIKNSGFQKVKTVLYPKNKYLPKTLKMELKINV